MSTSFGFYCHECGERLEGVASSSIAYGFKVWAGDIRLDALQAFLEAHVGHYLILEDDQKIDDIVDDLLDNSGGGE